MLIESGKSTTASYMSNTTPIPADKTAVVACTAMAGDVRLNLIFMDGGSGAKNPITKEMISSVRKSVDCPLIVGGGISSGEKLLKIAEQEQILLLLEMLLKKIKT